MSEFGQSDREVVASEICSLRIAALGEELHAQRPLARAVHAGEVGCGQRVHGAAAPAVGEQGAPLVRDFIINQSMMAGRFSARIIFRVARSKWLSSGYE